jgi:uncharacterized protein YpuA (DUF1002 family)
MAMTAAEKQKVINALDELDRSTLDKILASLNSFTNWLENQLYSIYCKIRDSIRSLWNSICNFFS